MIRLTDRTGITRRRLMQGTAAGVAGYALSPWIGSSARAEAGDLATIHETAAAEAKKLAGGRPITLKIMQPSGSLGNVKPVADRFTDATGIKFDYLEVPLGEINQKVLLEAVSKSGSFDLALPATFGIPDLAESGKDVFYGALVLEIDLCAAIDPAHCQLRGVDRDLDVWNT